MSLESIIPLEMLAKCELAPMNSTTEIIFGGTKNKNLSSIVKIKHKAQPIIKAIIWFRVRDDAKSPRAQYAAARKIAPRYPPITGPGSISPINDIKMG